MNAARKSGVFVFAAHSQIFSEIFLAARDHQTLGREIGQIHAIRFCRTTPRRER
jgi:hypothetical protein